MAFRKKRQTFDIHVQNLPAYVSEKDVSRRFTTFGEIQSIYVNKDERGGKSATVRFLCEPDADKAVLENHAVKWDNNIIFAQRYYPKSISSPKRFDANSGRSNALSCKMPFSVPFLRKPNLVPNMPGNMLHGTNSRSLPLPYADLRNVPPPPLPDAAFSNSNVLLLPEERSVLCTVVESPISFYCRNPERQSTYESIDYLMQSFCKALPRLKIEPVLGKLYAATYSGDGLWYRCIVKKMVSSRKILVHYVDYGNSEEINLHQMTDLPDCLRVHPHLAPKCVFANFVPALPKDPEDPKEAVRFLEEMIVGQYLTITTMSSKGCLLYDVTKCMLDNKNVIESMLQMSFISHPHHPSSESQALISPSIVTSPHPSRKLRVLQNPAKFSSGIPTNQAAKTSIGFVGKEVKASTNNSVPKITVLSRSASLKEPNQPEMESSKLRAMNTNLQVDLDNIRNKCEFQDQELKKKEVLLQKPNLTLKLESVDKHLQLINSIRCSGSHNEDKLVPNTINTLQNIQSTHLQPKAEQRRLIEVSNEAYFEALKRISHCEDKEQLSDLIDKKNLCCDTLCKYMNEYVVSSDETEREALTNDLQSVLKQLQDKSNSSIDIGLRKRPSSLDELCQEYNWSKAYQDMLSNTAKQSTDVAHAAFLDALSKLESAFPLCPLNIKDSEASINPPYSNVELVIGQLYSSLAELQEALDGEVNSMYMPPSLEGQVSCHVIESLIQEVQRINRSIQEEVSIAAKFKVLSEKLNVPDCSSHTHLISQACDVTKRIKTVKSKLRHRLADRKDLEDIQNFDLYGVEAINDDIHNLQRELHLLFKEKDDYLTSLMTVYKGNMPELDLQYPELAFSIYSKYDGIFKSGWEMEHFSARRLITRLIPSYEARFLDSPVVIKEFLLENEEKARLLTERVLAWNAINSKYLIKVLAMFEKNSIEMSIITPKLPNLVEEAIGFSVLNCCALLCTVLEGLDALHSKNMVHGMIHPAALLLHDGYISLDFLFETKNLLLDNQLMDWPRNIEASVRGDIFGFAFLVLALLFPSIRIQSNSPQSITIEDHRTMIEELLPLKDYLMLANILKHNLYPSAKSIIASGFLRKPKILMREHKIGNEVATTHFSVGRQVEGSTVATSEVPSSVAEGHKGSQKAAGGNSMLDHMVSLRRPLNYMEKSNTVTSHMNDNRHPPAPLNNNVQ